jgi:hypothetical protein
MIRYYVRVPGWAHAMTAYGMGKRDAIARFRKQHGFRRMPKGYGIWEATT